MSARIHRHAISRWPPFDISVFCACLTCLQAFRHHADDSNRKNQHKCDTRFNFVFEIWLLMCLASVFVRVCDLHVVYYIFFLKSLRLFALLVGCLIVIISTASTNFRLFYTTDARPQTHTSSVYFIRQSYKADISMACLSLYSFFVVVVS